MGALILAAGASRRLGEPKQLVQLQSRTGGERLLERAVRVAREGGCSTVSVVLGAQVAVIRSTCRLDGVTIVENVGWREGMGGSIRCGMGTLPPVSSGVVLMVCDQPAVTGAHLRALVRAGMETGQAVGSTYAGRKGVPAFFPTVQFENLARLRGEEGARELLASARTIDLPGGELDVDTQETLDEVRQLFAR